MRKRPAQNLHSTISSAGNDAAYSEMEDAQALKRPGDGSTIGSKTNQRIAILALLSGSGCVTRKILACGERRSPLAGVLGAQAVKMRGPAPADPHWKRWELLLWRARQTHQHLGFW